MSQNTEEEPTIQGSLDNQTLWRLIHTYFNDTPQHLVTHHIESYNDFFKKDIFDIFKDRNPIKIVSGLNASTGEYKHQALLYFGGKDGTRIYFGKPVIHDKDRAHYMYPNEARLRNMTYAMTVHYDIEVEFVDQLAPGEAPYVIGPEFLTGGQDQAADEEEPDYSDAFAEEERNNLQNYKLQGGLPEEVPGETKQIEQEGGARKVPARITPSMATQLRELTEQSLVSGTTQKRTLLLEKVYLGKIPIMVQSDMCILSGMSRELRHGFGECKNDPGGYFIIAGKEKTIAVQEKFGDNMLYIKKGKPAPHEEGVADDYLWSAEIRSVSENVSKPKRNMSVQLLAPKAKYTNLQIVVNIPNVRAPVPLFIVFRALGVLSDRAIIETCLLDLEKYEFMVDAFAPSVHDAGGILHQQMAIQFIGELTKFHSADYALEILNDFFLPHIGESNYVEKAYFLGYMVFRLLSASMDLEQETDRDHLKYKRIEPFGTLFRDLFQEYYAKQQKYVYQEFDKRIYFNNNEYEHNLFALIYNNYREILGNRMVDDGLKKAFKGSWGAETHTKRVGIVQDVNRLSFNSAISHLRKINLPLDSSLKVVGPRILHCSHWGYIDFIDTPDGGNIGLHKTFAITTYVSRGYARDKIIAWLRENAALKPLTECSPIFLSSQTKLFVNGYWAGVIDTPLETISKFRLYRRNGLIPIHTSISFDIRRNMVSVFTDAGRMCRPIFYKDDITGRFSFDLPRMRKRLSQGELAWSNLVSGFNAKLVAANYQYTDVQIRDLDDLYDAVNGEKNPAKIDRFLKDKAVVEYIDSSEIEHTLVALSPADYANNPEKQPRYTHMEIHASFLFGIMCNQVIFPENNPAARISFSCSQSRQSCSMYHTNFQNRMDKTAVVLNSGQVPLLKSRYMTHLNREENPYGENAIVAIMCYGGYNVEDAILVNEGALKRGLFQTTYYTTYQEHEERKQVGEATVDKRFTCIEKDPSVTGLKPGHDYSKLDQHGLIRENTPVDEKTILIGYTSNSAVNVEKRKDLSICPKKGQLGVVDKAFITEGEEGERIAKVRIREIRVPNLGDKMASRAGQKGTVGLVIPEKDMPFTKDGIRPDLIINPHALPSRQTIGHLVECLIGKACVHFGGFSDCTAFNNEGSKAAMFGKLLPKLGYHSSGNEILYNGMTGEQIDMEIFIGPNYYMRLKHMVKDKVNFRALGPRTALTKQPVAGRANDGGLRIGEMERDVLISHGMTDFLRESMMERGDQYYMAVCNMTGLLAVYNPARNVFLSPMADGPLRFFKGDTNNGGYSLDTISRYGRRFSLVSIPYSLKLLIQELQAINVQMHIITEDNIDQIESMSYSDNIQKLTIDPTMNPSRLVQSIKSALQGEPEPVRTPLLEIEKTVSAEYPEDVSPPYPADVSPAYVPEEPFTPDSVPYIPQELPPTENRVIGRMGLEEDDRYDGGTRIPMEGGNPMDQFQLGGNVYYLRSKELGLPSEHLWQIVKKGGKLLTIQCSPNSGLSNPADYIQIAKCDELIDPNSMMAMKLRQERVQKPVIPLNMNPFPEPATPHIHVNPIIKIVNGDDNSTAPPTITSASEEPTSLDNASFSSLQIQNPMKAGSTKTEVPPADKDTTIGGALTNLKNVFINKLTG